MKKVVGESRKILRRYRTQARAGAYPNGPAAFQVSELDKKIQNEDRRVADEEHQHDDHLRVGEGQQDVDEKHQHEVRLHDDDDQLHDDRRHLVDDVRRCVEALPGMKDLLEVRTRCSSSLLYTPGFLRISSYRSNFLSAVCGCNSASSSRR